MRDRESECEKESAFVYVCVLKRDSKSVCECLDVCEEDSER